MFDFEINGEKWTIEEKNNEFLLEKYNEHREDKAYYMFGLTTSPDRKIYLNKDISSDDQRRRTLFHELMHAYLWTVGACNFSHFDEEDLCNFSSASHDIVHKIVNNYLSSRT